MSVGGDKLIKLWDIAPAVALLTSEANGTDAAAADGGKKKGKKGGADAPAAVGGGPLQLKTLAAVAGHDKDINCVAVAPNDQLVATGSMDKTARVWSLPDLVQVRGLSVCVTHGTRSVRGRDKEANLGLGRGRTGCSGPRIREQGHGRAHECRDLRRASAVGPLEGSLLQSYTEFR